MSNDKASYIEILREKRTATYEAGCALMAACDFYVHLWSIAKKLDPNNQNIPVDPEASFFENEFKNAWGNSDVNGDILVEAIQKKIDSVTDIKDDSAVLMLLIDAADIVIAYAIQAMKADEIEGDNNLAWTYAFDAKHWADNLRYSYGRPDVSNPAAALAKLRHRENYQLADEAIKHWKENIDPKLSASKAANELIKVVPLSHKKLAEIISAAKKKHI